MKHKFKVSLPLKSYIGDILARQGIPFRFKEENGQFFVLTSISGERFHKIVKRAYCEKLTEETGLLHLTFEESMDPKLSYGLMKQFGKSGFVVAGSKN